MDRFTPQKPYHREDKEQKYHIETIRAEMEAALERYYSRAKIEEDVEHARVMLEKCVELWQLAASKEDKNSFLETIALFSKIYENKKIELEEYEEIAERS